VKDQQVFVVTTPSGKTSVRTRPVNAPGYTSQSAVISPKAARVISDRYLARA
jgi:hypothetical protein